MEQKIRYFIISIFSFFLLTSLMSGCHVKPEETTNASATPNAIYDYENFGSDAATSSIQIIREESTEVIDTTDISFSEQTDRSYYSYEPADPDSSVTIQVDKEEY